MASVTFQDATRTYPGTSRPAVKDLNLVVEDGEFLVLVGPSGCGKSTTLRMLAGLEQLNSGRVYVAGRDVTDVPPQERDIAMVFQNYALYPHMTVRENMGFALKIAGEPKQEIRRRVDEAAHTLDLVDYLDRKPKALSGGQRQRVAMGRAIVRKPQVFLMDEPLSNLDAKLRVQTRAQIAALQRELGVTMVYVTHDQTEAMTMGDRIAVMNEGVVQQVGSPREIYDHPLNSFVAGFIGSPAMNMAPFRVVGNAASLGDATVTLPESVREVAAAQGLDQVLVGVRPEKLQVVESGEGEAHTPVEGLVFQMVVELVEQLGADSYIYGYLAGVGTQDGLVETGRVQVVARIPGHMTVSVGDSVTLQAEESQLHYFSVETGLRLS